MSAGLEDVPVSHFEGEDISASGGGGEAGVPPVFDIVNDPTLKSYEDFEDIPGIPEWLLRNVFSHGFAKPTPIQTLSIAPVIEGRDTIAQAQSGMGKTGAFTTGTMGRLYKVLSEEEEVIRQNAAGEIEWSEGYDRVPRAILVSNSRELAAQTHAVCCKLGEGVFKSVLCIGGISTQRNQSEIRSGCDILVGTPGRINSLAESGVFDPTNVILIILDEFDALLDMEGIDEDNQLNSVWTLLPLLPDRARIGMFSATFPDEIKPNIARFVHDPACIVLSKEEVPLEGIRNFKLVLAESPGQRDLIKTGAVITIFKKLTVPKCVIYAGRKSTCESLRDQLISQDFSVNYIHAGIPQSERDAVIRAFRTNTTRILISTDLTARGMDVQTVQLVINYDLPMADQLETYIHRVGRSGRHGRKGFAINLVYSDDDRYMIECLEKEYGCRVEPLPRDLEKVIRV